MTDQSRFDVIEKRTAELEAEKDRLKEAMEGGTITTVVAVRAENHRLRQQIDELEAALNASRQ